MTTCTHLDHVRITQLPASVEGSHAQSTSHPLIRSLEPQEEWSWCFVDQVAMVIPEVQGATRIPPSPLG
jgi:hypothetical protein